MVVGQGGGRPPPSKHLMRLPKYLKRMKLNYMNIMWISFVKNFSKLQTRYVHCTMYIAQGTF